MDLYQNYKNVALIAPIIQTATTIGSAVDVETLEDDAVVIAQAGAITGGSPSVVVTLTGSLKATPTTYDQTLATFPAFTATGFASANVNLAGIKNVKAVFTQTGAGNVPISACLIANNAQDSSALNSSTFA